MKIIFIFNLSYFVHQVKLNEIKYGLNIRELRELRIHIKITF